MIRRSIGWLLAAALSAAPVVASEGTVTVCAAASLKEAFFEIGRVLETASPETRVAFNFAASGQLVQQIAHGAPCDVLATADPDSMDRAVRDGRVVPDTRATFASNQLVLVVPAEGSTSVGGLDDLASAAGVRVALGTPESVPAGLYAKEALQLAGRWDVLKDRLVFGENVRQVLDYVARGEVGAGFVYATDARLMPDRVRVVGPVKTKRPILYPIAVIRDGGNEDGGRRFVEAVRSESGRRVLGRFGFGAP